MVIGFGERVMASALDESKPLDLLENTSNGYDHAKDAPVGNSALTCNPAKGHYQAGFDVADYGTAYWTSTDNNEELRKIDERRKKAALHANVSAYSYGLRSFQLHTERIINHL